MAEAHMRNGGGAWKVMVLDPCLSWLHGVWQADRALLIQIVQAVTALAGEGPGLGRPLVVAVPGSRLPNLQELRPGSRGSTEVRLLFVFDPYRRAVFLVGGDKSGKWADWLQAAIRQAEEAYGDYLSSERTKMSQPPRSSPAARSWGDLAGNFAFSPEEERQIRDGADQMVAEVRILRLVGVRNRQNVTRAEVAAAMGVSQARVAHIEKGQLEPSELDTLAAYVKALGGKLKVVADFGDESYVLG
jgi:DNA-binding XRE family transcriptional regulator